MLGGNCLFTCSQQACSRAGLRIVVGEQPTTTVDYHSSEDIVPTCCRKCPRLVGRSKQLGYIVTALHDPNTHRCIPTALRLTIAGTAESQSKQRRPNGPPPVEPSTFVKRSKRPTRHLVCRIHKNGTRSNPMKPGACLHLPWNQEAFIILMDRLYQ